MELATSALLITDADLCNMGLLTNALEDLWSLLSTDRQMVANSCRRALSVYWRGASELNVHVYPQIKSRTAAKAQRANSQTSGLLHSLCAPALRRVFQQHFHKGKEANSQHLCTYCSR